MQNRRQRILYVVNVDWFFLSHRLPLALEAIRRGMEVYLLTFDTGRREEIESYGIKFIQVDFERSGHNPLHELKCVLQLRKLYKDLEADIIHHVTLKASLLGSLAAKLSKQKNVVNAISGLGYNFTGNRDGLLQKTIRRFMDIAFKSEHSYFILQNPNDLEALKQMKFVPESHYKLIKGSGVDLNAFKPIPRVQKEKIHILFPARILRDKGVIELIEAAKKLKDRFYGKVLFKLIGSCDQENKAALTESEIESMMIPGYLEWYGFQKNMLDQYRDSDIVVLPSYREGLPKSLIEACAVGLPIITTDAPGCRECVIPDFNGIMVPVQSVDPLADAIEHLCKNPSERERMGINSRELAEKEFSIERVIEKTFSIYKQMIN